ARGRADGAHGRGCGPSAAVRRGDGARILPEPHRRGCDRTSARRGRVRARRRKRARAAAPDRNEARCLGAIRRGGSPIMSVSSAAVSVPKPRSRVLHRSLREVPPIAASGHGVWLVDAQGREVLDGSGGAAVSCLGHQHPRVLEAVMRQADKLAYAHTRLFSWDAAEALADELVGHEPGGLAYAYLVCGGSEAIEAALKMARQYFLEIGQPRRTRFIGRRQSYHGNTLGALAAGGHAARREPYAPLLSDAFSHVTPAFAYREQRQEETE